MATGRASSVEKVGEPRGDDSATRRRHSEIDELVGSAEAGGETVGAFEAKTHLSRLLADVQRGRVITITRRGVPVATLAPPDEVRSGDAGPSQRDEEENDERARQAIAAWVEYRDAQPNLRASSAEIVAWVKEGRR